MVRLCLIKASLLPDKFRGMAGFLFFFVTTETLEQSVTWVGAIGDPQCSDSLMVT